MRKCRACKELYTPARPMQTACSVGCALTLVKKTSEKIKRQEVREAKAKLKTRSQWVKEAQTAFNAYIRARDVDLPCISCGDFTPMTRGGDYDCGHYRSVGANPELRFEELNSHKQCKRCNSYLSGNIVNYRIGLLMRIGEEKVAWIEGPHEAKKYTVDDLAAIKKTYQQKLKALKTNPVYPV